MRVSIACIKWESNPQFAFSERDGGSLIEKVSSTPLEIDPEVSFSKSLMEVSSSKRYDVLGSASFRRRS